MTTIQMTRKERIQKANNQKKALRYKKGTTLALAGTIAVSTLFTVTNQANAAEGDCLCQFYSVKKGDTLFGLATKYGVSIEDIKVNNDLKSNTIYIGQKLELPNENVHNKKPHDVSIAPKPVTQSKKVSKPVQAITKKVQTSKTYTVVGGDTIWSLAKRFGTSVDFIKKANNKKGDFIIIGEKLIVSQNSTSEVVTINGAVDTTHIEVSTKKGEIKVLTVSYGQASKFGDFTGKKMNIVYKGSSLISYSI